MKQAEHCGFSSKPTLNQTGELKAAIWLTRIAFSSASKVSASSSVGEVAALAAPAGDRVDDAADHLLDASARARASDMRPRKYFWATMFVAVCDQNFGNSTSFCSKAGPSLPGMQRVADLPLDLVERVAARDREVATRRDRSIRIGNRVRVLVGGVYRCGGRLLCGCHLVLQIQSILRRLVSRTGPTRPAPIRGVAQTRDRLGCFKYPIFAGIFLCEPGWSIAVRRGCSDGVLRLHVERFRCRSAAEIADATEHEKESGKAANHDESNRNRGRIGRCKRRSTGG